MAPSNDEDRPKSSSSDADLAQAYRDLTRGEQTATALEANLSTLESKLDAILAALEANEAQTLKPASNHKTDRNSDKDASAGGGNAEDVAPKDDKA